MSADHRIKIKEPGPRPPFYKIAEYLWGRGCNVDSDGDSSNPDDTEWTELTLILRSATAERVDIDPASLEPLILEIRSSDRTLCERVSAFIVGQSGGSIESHV